MPPFKHRNRFDVRVVFPDGTFAIKNPTDVELTPEDVAKALEEFVMRIRSKVPPAADAVDPQAGSPGNPSPRDESDFLMTTTGTFTSYPSLVDTLPPLVRKQRRLEARRSPRSRKTRRTRKPSAIRSISYSSPPACRSRSS